MITAIEQAVAAATIAALESDSSLAGVPYVVTTATSRDEVPGDRSVVGVRVAQAPRTMHVLADYELELVVGTPAVSEATSVQQHSLVEQAVAQAWEAGRVLVEATEEDPAETMEQRLAAEIEERMPGWTGAGYFNRGWQPGREETAWMPAMALLVGARQVDGD